LQGSIDREVRQVFHKLSTHSDIPSRWDYDAVWAFLKVKFGQDLVSTNTHAFRRPLESCITELVRRLKEYCIHAYPENALATLRDLARQGARCVYQL
jgi:hypothetical protein